MSLVALTLNIKDHIKGNAKSMASIADVCIAELESAGHADIRKGWVDPPELELHDDSNKLKQSTRASDIFN